MQERPDAIELLGAIARFLDADLRPAVADAGLAFRVRVVANLVRMVADGLRHEEAHLSAELNRLIALLPDVMTGHRIDRDHPDQRRQALRTLNRELARRIREGTLSEPARARAQEHLLATLADAVTVVDPSFDLSPDIE